MLWVLGEMLFNFLFFWGADGYGGIGGGPAMRCIFFDFAAQSKKDVAAVGARVGVLVLHWGLIFLS